MQLVHTMIRVSDLDKSLHFYCDLLGLVQTRRIDNEKGRFSLIFLAAPEQAEHARQHFWPEIELTYNWDPDPEPYGIGRAFGHLAFRVDDIYGLCTRLMQAGVTIHRPPRDGHMAFIRSPDNISIELIQKLPDPPPQEPWVSMKNDGWW